MDRKTKLDANHYKMANKLGAAASLFVLMSVTACGTSGPKVDNSGLDEVNARQAALDKREKELNMQAKALKSQKSSLSHSAPAGPSYAGGTELLPPGAKAGECYTRVWVPPTYKSQSEQRLVSEASERIEIIPAKYGKVSKRVLVQEASSRIETIPATYKYVTEKVLVQEAQTVKATVLSSALMTPLVKSCVW